MRQWFNNVGTRLITKYVCFLERNAGLGSFAGLSDSGAVFQVISEENLSFISEARSSTHGFKDDRIPKETAPSSVHKLPMRAASKVYWRNIKM